MADKKPGKKPKQRSSKKASKKKYRKPALVKHGVLSIIEGD